MTPPVPEASASPYDPATTVALLVTYEPDLERLKDVLRALAGQGVEVIAIDNGSEHADTAEALLANAFAASDQHASFTRLDSNIGLAAAQNLAAEQAWGRGATAILLLDQDTVLPAGAVRTLCAAAQMLDAEGARPAAIGPVYFDGTSHRQSGAWRAAGWRIGRADFKKRNDVSVAPADFVIASGALIARDVWDAVGGMEASLFIDLVDVEWGLRAQGFGFESYQVADVVIDHRIGEGRVRIGPITAPRHSPVRNYYWVRNALTLAKRGALPKAWRLYFLTRSLAYAGFYPLFGDQRWARLRHIARGVWDGLLGRLG
ncbi:MAG: glycosyltransferase family 2 protein [Pseudomonadota bacterium]